MASQNNNESFKSSLDFINDLLYEENYNINEELNNTHNIDEELNIYNMEPIAFDIEAFLRAKEHEFSNDISSLIDESIVENEDIDNFIETTNNDIDNFIETTNNDIDIIIKKESSLALTPCVVIDKINGTIQHCKIDKKSVENVKLKLENLGVCSNHFNFDQNRLHDKGDKKLKSISESIIRKRRCLFCGNYYYFFSRGNDCKKHSWIVNGKSIQIPCIGLKNCPSLDNCNEIYKLAFGNVKSSRFICCEYYEKNGGHIYIRPGRCKELPNCIKDDSKSKNNSEILNKENISSIQNIPSFFAIKTIFKLNQIPISFEEKTLDSITCEQIGIQMANQLWKSRSKLKQNKSKLESPSSIEEYYDAFPSFLIIFLNSFINLIAKKKVELTNRKFESQNKPSKQSENTHIIKIVTFLTSVFVTFSFPSLKVWLPQLMASLSRRPRLLSSFHSLLTKCSVIVHTNRHECRLEKTQMINANPTKRLIKNEKIFNLAVIDNIDFKETTFQYGNIYDVTRGNSHATLRMAFQTTLPQSFPLEERVVELTRNSQLFGMSELHQETFRDIERSGS
ncbi:hypothetical protein Glove_184g123 [Diversispora epigaea]|uniref:Uncharacterized protein n=1 Tax=Diversispora epigaea TaxID=1348612 RepID=A0A397IVY3_9GLOM|nr:hypothetical protein Glove_184g123 [Diversispora epigaea]